MYSRYRLGLTSVALLLCMSVAAIAQLDRPSLVDPSRRSSAPVRMRATVITKVVPKIVRERVKISSIGVTTEPGAKVVLQPGVATAKNKAREKIADAAGAVQFEDVSPGTYKLQASKEGFETAEADAVTVKLQESSLVPLDLKPITYRLKIETNLTGGEVFYARRDEKNMGASGSIAADRLGNYCVVKIGRNGGAEVSDLKTGYYFIDIRPGPESPEFDEIHRAVTVPDEIDSIGGAPVKIDLEKKVSTEAFTTAWVPADWEMPAPWRLDNGLKVKNSDGIALPRNERYRHYLNFEMIANVRLLDSGTVGFVLRAQDPKNYYLLQLSAVKAQDPDTASLYLIKNGVSQLINSATTAAFSKTLTSNNGFRIIIKGERSDFTIWIEDSDTGKTHAVGRLSDQYDSFKKGAIGIAALAKSDFVVNYFAVCTPACPK